MNNHTVLCGKTERQSFSRIPEALELPNLLSIQKESFEWFLKEGLREVFEDISPIKAYSGNLTLEFVDYKFDKDTEYTVQDAKDRDMNYSRKLNVTFRLIKTRDEQVVEVQEQDVYFGGIPMMTDSGTFIINGAERVIVSQLVRSPGVYFAKEYDKSGNNMISSTVIPNRGAWIEFDNDANGIISVRIDRTRKLPATTLIRALIFENDEEMIEALGDSEYLRATLEKETSKNRTEALIEIHKKLKPGDLASLDSATSLVNNLFFEEKRYELARVGRYKFNKKLSIVGRIKDKYAAEDVETEDGEILVSEGELITFALAEEIERNHINSVKVFTDERKEKVVKVLGNMFFPRDSYEELKEFTFEELEDAGLENKLHYPNLLTLINDEQKYISKDHKGRLRELKKHKKFLSPRTITNEDILSIFSYQLTLYDGIGSIDDIDHLGNRRVRPVGELLQNQVRVGLARMEKTVKEKMTVGDQDAATPQTLLNVRPVSAAIKEFFGSSQLSQFMDQTNPMSELTHKRRLSALGPGGLSRERAGYEVRDVHDSHYGRICPIETPEGPNIGLITSLTTYGRINKYGFIETPYRKVELGTGRVTDEIVYLTADEEDNYIKAQANEPLDENNVFVNERVSGRGIDAVNDIYPRNEVELMDVSPQQIVSVGAAMIPFLENDDATRALMGTNMQRQAVPLIKTEAPVIATGIEHKAALDSGVVVKSKNAGTVKLVADSRIIIEKDIPDEDGPFDYYTILKFKRANQGTCVNQRPIVKEGEHVEAEQIIADGPSTDNGEVALGKNILIAFMTWEGYNYEDAMLINEKLVIDDTLTSVHIEEHTCDARKVKLGNEEITREIPNVSEEMKKNLDEDGVIRIGAEVHAGDILVGKVSPKGETELSPEEKLLRSIFDDKAREVKDHSLKVPHGEEGIVVDVKKYSRENKDELPPGVLKSVNVYIAAKRKISVGDKMCGRHGNKGVVSRILPEEDMPFLPDGTPIQICLNPLGIPSRMNLGQVLEVHLGLAAKKLGWKVATPVFDGATDKDIEEALQKAGYPVSGKIRLRDGRTGEEFHNDVTVGYMYILKLHHMVDEKIHARSIGPYSLVTQQPLGGKAQFGGQRFGEMEVWALEAYGASHTLQEMLTVKSDDITGRVSTYEAIVRGENIPEPGIPESFKVLVKELQALSLDVRLLDETGEEIELDEEVDDFTRFSQVENNNEIKSSENSHTHFLKHIDEETDEVFNEEYQMEESIEQALQSEGFSTVDFDDSEEL